MLPAVLRLQLQRRVCALSDRVRCVRRDHLWCIVQGCAVLVRFNAANIVVRSSSGQTTGSVDILVSAPPEKAVRACAVLARIMLQLVVLLSDGSTAGLQFSKHAVVRRTAADCNDPSVVSDPDPDLGFAIVLDLDTNLVSDVPSTAGALEPYVNQQCREPLGLAVADANELGQYLQLLKTGSQVMHLLTDPCFVVERLRGALPRGTTPEGRFGVWALPDVPVDEAAVDAPAAGPAKLPAHTRHHDGTFTVLDTLVAHGRFGAFMFAGRLHDSASIACRIVRAGMWAKTDMNKLQRLVQVSMAPLLLTIDPIGCRVLANGDLAVPYHLDPGQEVLSLDEALARIHYAIPSPEQALLKLAELVSGLAAALSVLHALGLPHGRLSIRHSVLLYVQGRSNFHVLLSDCGVPVDDGVAPLRADELAPEMREHPTPPTLASDLYQLGLIARHVYTGAELWSADSVRVQQIVSVCVQQM